MYLCYNEQNGFFLIMSMVLEKILNMGRAQIWFSARGATGSYYGPAPS